MPVRLKLCRMLAEKMIEAADGEDREKMKDLLAQLVIVSRLFGVVEV